MAKLHFYYSSMNAGKSALLLQSSYNYRECGMDTLLLIPRSAARSDGKITSRIGLEQMAYAFDKNVNLYDYVKQAVQQNHNIKCILVDEAHFLSKKNVEELSDIVDYLNIPVLAYGLRTDFRGEVFESSKYLLGWADILIELKTICHCGRKAVMVVRLDQDGNVVKEGQQYLVGGNERYVAVCRKHFKEGRIAAAQH